MRPCHGSGNATLFLGIKVPFDQEPHGQPNYHASTGTQRVRQKISLGRVTPEPRLKKLNGPSKRQGE